MGIRQALQRWMFGSALPVWYHPSYRMPVSHQIPRAGLDPRRSDLAWWALKEQRGVRHRQPRRATYAELVEVHTTEWLERLSQPGTLARVLGIDGPVPIDPVMATYRYAVGATLGATREVLATGGAALNLLGGFHHASPNRGGGLCPINDIAVALAAARGQGFRGQVVILDLDAHPPDGLADCLGADDSVWIGSLSGVSWGDLDGVDETVLPEGTADPAYLAALAALMSRCPQADLAYVIAGADVLDGDPLGQLGLSLSGLRERDRQVAAMLSETPSVWLPGGGYSRQAWEALVGTGLVLLGRPSRRVPKVDAVGARFDQVYGELPFDEDPELTVEDLFPGPRTELKVLGRYNAEAIEFALHAYGILGHLRGLGFDRFEVQVGGSGSGDRVQVFGRSEPDLRHLLIEAVLDRERIDGRPVLYVNWLTLRNPLAQFTAERPRLPGQEVPGLGLAREASTLLERIAQRLELDGIAFRPASLHIAFAARRGFRFHDPRRQSQLETLLSTFTGQSLIALTAALEQGRILLNGEIWRWESTLMVRWLNDDRAPSPEGSWHFELLEAPWNA